MKPQHPTSIGNSTRHRTRTVQNSPFFELQGILGRVLRAVSLQDRLQWDISIRANSGRTSFDIFKAVDSCFVDTHHPSSTLTYSGGDGDGDSDIV